MKLSARNKTLNINRVLHVCRPFLFLFYFITWCSSCQEDSTEKWYFNFESADIGKIPEGWSSHTTGEGVSDWRVMNDANNQVLAQWKNINPDDHFNLIIYDSLSAHDCTISVKMRAVGGIWDRGGGILWRYQDENNHYILRANPLENDLVLFKVENGERTDLPLLGIGRTYGADVNFSDDKWHTISVTAQGDIFIAFFDGKEIFSVRDTTFERQGKIGLWTKSDARTFFDDLKVTLLH